MAIASRVRDIFGYFENLNLLVLLEDLRMERAARQGWSRGKQLCPIAHGLPTGFLIRELTRLGQSADLARGCDHAARHLGANSSAIQRFISLWDEGSISPNWLLHQLEELWGERLENACAVQELICEPGTDDAKEAHVAGAPHPRRPVTFETGR